MQTFLPYRNYRQSAQSLDNRRLGKQRVECLQILKSLTIDGYGWRNHPAVKMWHGYKGALIQYSLDICNEWRSRGFKDTCLDKIMDFMRADDNNDTPPWLTDEFCLSHQSNLLRKDPAFYRHHFPEVPDNLPYLWPE
jgi:Pyrimidine dimer DNA glycosylase